MKQKTIFTIILALVIFVLCIVIPISVNADKETHQHTYVWFEGLVAIDGQVASTGMLLAEGQYCAALVDGSSTYITVSDGYWYFS